VPPIAHLNYSNDTVRSPLPNHLATTVNSQACHFANRRTFPHRNHFVTMTT
jgi:hypothetical protein